MTHLSPLIQQWASSPNKTLAQWSESLPELFQTKTSGSPHANLWHQWMAMLEQLPAHEDASLNVSDDVINLTQPKSETTDDQRAEIRAVLLKLAPWRIGPWNVCGVDLQAEWNALLKWNRIKEHVWFEGANVLDVGCNNGWFGWQAIAAGAQSVIGCDPFLLYNVQHELFRRYSRDKHRHYILPIADHEIPDDIGAFDVVMSLGVLIHRRSPIDHLMRLRSSLRKRGQLVLETMAIDSRDSELVVPQDRFMKMRGIWFVPTVATLKSWLQRTGFTDIKTVAISVTDSTEQSQTEFMTFESLSDFLDPSDPSKTVEGYPAPVRVALVATRG